MRREEAAKAASNDDYLVLRIHPVLPFAPVASPGCATLTPKGFEYFTCWSSIESRGGQFFPARVVGRKDARGVFLHAPLMV